MELVVNDRAIDPLDRFGEGGLLSSAELQSHGTFRQLAEQLHDSRLEARSHVRHHQHCRQVTSCIYAYMSGSKQVSK